MQTRSKWLLPVIVLVIVVAGVVLLWWRSDVTTTDSWWARNGSWALPLVIPPITALLAWVFKQAISSRPERSTPEQLSAAQQALIGRGREWWRGVPEPAWPGQLLRAGLKPLDVTWAEPQSDDPPGDGSFSGNSGNIPGLVDRFRQTYPCRLVITGSAGSGKSVLARMMMAELLKDPKLGEPVPVFLPLWSWSPRDERLHDWMKRQIALACPELADEAVYGPTAVANLVDQGGVLPILDGLDALTKQNRKDVLDDGELMSQDRLILTYRGAGFRPANGFTVIKPKAVKRDEACRFLWEAAHFDASSSPNLSEWLSDPRMIYLASIIYGEDRARRAVPEESASNGDKSFLTPKGQLLASLIPALTRVDDNWTRQFPWYVNKTKNWLRSLVWLDLRDPDNRRPEFDPDEPGDSRIAWWNLHRAIPWLRGHQAVFRAAVIGLAAFALITLNFRTRSLTFRNVQGWPYSLFTAGGYGLMIFVAGCFFGRQDSGRLFGREDSVATTDVSFPEGKPFEVPWRWLHDKWTRWGRVLVAGVLGCILFGLMIGIRTGLSSGSADGFRTAVWDGLVQGAVIIILTFFIAGVPAPPRTALAVDRGETAHHDFGSFIRAMILGLALGVLWGGSIVLKHQQTHIAPTREDLIVGLVVGINFALGAWFFGWVRAWFISARASDPRSASRADMVGAVVCSLILGATYWIAFGISVASKKSSVPFTINKMDANAWFVVGAAIGILGSEWPLYATAITWFSLKKSKLQGKGFPFRLMRFLEFCRVRGIVRMVGQEYQFSDDDMLEYLSGRPKGKADRTESSAADSGEDTAKGSKPGSVSVSTARG